MTHVSLFNSLDSQSFETVADLMSFLGVRLHQKVNKSITIGLLYSDYLLTRDMIQDRFRVKTTAISKNSDIFLCEKFIVSEQKQLQWIMTRVDEYNVYLVISFEGIKYFKQYIEKYLNRLYPYISKAFLTTQKIFNPLFEVMDNKLSHSIIVTKTVAKKRIYTTGKHSTYSSTIEWAELPFKTVYSRLIDENAWVNSLSINIRPNSYKVYSHSDFSMYRDGIISCRSGLQFVYDNVLLRLTRGMVEDQNLLKNRSRGLLSFDNVKPLAIVFSSKPFSDVTVNRKLIDAIKKLPMSSCSVYHSNPYLDLSLVDNKDGSSYQIYIFSDYFLTIIPQIKSTVASLERIVNHIGETFMEGIVKDLSDVCYE